MQLSIIKDTVKRILLLLEAQRLDVTDLKEKVDRQSAEIKLLREMLKKK